MKKHYSKPDISYEGFSLSTNIAAGCEEVPVNSTDNCGVKWGKSVIFTSTMTGCPSKVADGSPEHDGLCYHNPSADYNVFTS